MEAREGRQTSSTSQQMQADNKYQEQDGGVKALSAWLPSQTVVLSDSYMTQKPQKPCASCCLEANNSMECDKVMPFERDDLLAELSISGFHIACKAWL